MTQRKRHFTADEARQIIDEYGTTTLKDLAQRYHADTDVVREAITTNGGAIRPHWSHGAAERRIQERTEQRWKIGAFKNYLERGVPFPVAQRMALLSDLPEQVVRQRLALFELSLPFTHNTTTLPQGIDNAEEV